MRPDLKKEDLLRRTSHVGEVSGLAEKGAAAKKRVEEG